MMSNMALAGKMWCNPKHPEGTTPNPNYSQNQFEYGGLYGWNAVAKNGNTQDDHGHGTHGAGSIAAICNIPGMIEIMACKCLNSENKGKCADFVQCIRYACNNGARILNCSWGFDQGITPNDWLTLDTELERVCKLNNPPILVFASGNTSKNIDNDSSSYPASRVFKNLVAVAATTETNDLAWYSNHGTRKVHIAAPGEHILSLWSGANTNYEHMSGTSAAAPIFTSALTLMMVKFPNIPNNDLKEELLIAADQNIPLINGEKATIYGKLNVAKALEWDGGSKLSNGLVLNSNSNLSSSISSCSASLPNSSSSVFSSSSSTSDYSNSSELPCSSSSNDKEGKKTQT